MTGPKPIRLGKSAPLLSSESVDPTISTEDYDWDGGGYAGEASVNDQWKQPVRAATTASITISTALNNGDTLDGVTLATGDRVLVKDQGTGSQNGIYIVGATPERAPDFDDDDEALGAIVYVIAGTTNAATAWKVTNTSAITLGSTSIVFAAFGAGGASFGTPALTLSTSNAAGAAATAIRTDATVAVFDATNPAAVGTALATGSAGVAARRDHVHTSSVIGGVTVSGTPSSGDVIAATSSSAAAWAAPASGGSTIIVKDEGSTLTTAATTLDFVGAGVTATGTGATKTITIPGASGGGLTMPTMVQVKETGNASVSQAIAAAASGHTLLLYTNATTGQVTSVACTNTTWTQVKTANDGTGFYALWVGVVSGGSSGTSITWSKPGSFASAITMEIADTLTPTMGANTSASSAVNSATVDNSLILTGTTSGRILVFCAANSNTGISVRQYTSIPTVGVSEAIMTMRVGYSIGTPVNLQVFTTNSGVDMIVELT